MEKIKKGNKGFTLIELLVVISVIGLLASVVLVALNGARIKARDVRRKADLKQLQTALEFYYDKYGSYPVNAGGNWWSACNGWIGNKGTSGPNGWIPNLAPEFISQLPLDPKRGTSIGTMTGPTGATDVGQFCYIYNSDGSNYKIAAHCASETGPVNNGDAFYVGHDVGWSCSTYHFSLWNSAVSQGW